MSHFFDSQELRAEFLIFSAYLFVWLHVLPEEEALNVPIKLNILDLNILRRNFWILVVRLSKGCKLVQWMDFRVNNDGSFHISIWIVNYVTHSRFCGRPERDRSIWRYFRFAKTGSVDNVLRNTYVNDESNSICSISNDIQWEYEI